MNRFLTLLPVSLWLAGCNSSASTSSADTALAQETPIAETTTSTSEAQPVSTQRTTTTNNAAQGNKTGTKPNASGAAKPKAASKSKATAKATPKPDSRYRVVEGPPNIKVPPPPENLKVGNTVRVRMTTTRGAITLELNGKLAPLHVKSFVYLSRRGFYDNTVFHRHANLLEPTGEGYIIQGGDALTKHPQYREFAGNGNPGYSVPNESNSMKHDRLVIAAARTDDPDSAGSQFYITQNPVPGLDDMRFTVFGRVVGGQENALKLRAGDVIKRVEVLK